MKHHVNQKIRVSVLMLAVFASLWVTTVFVTDAAAEGDTAADAAQIIPTVALSVMQTANDAAGGSMTVSAIVVDTSADVSKGVFPAGTVTFTLVGSSGSDVVDSSSPITLTADETNGVVGVATHVFSELADGNYTVQAVYMPSDSAAYGENESECLFNVSSSAILLEIEPVYVMEKTYVEHAEFDLSENASWLPSDSSVEYDLMAGEGVIAVESTNSTVTYIDAGIAVIQAKIPATDGDITDSNYSALATFVVIIQKETVEIPFPTASSISYGQTLDSSSLSFTENDYGTFAWKNGGQIPTVSNSGYEVVFTPSEAAIAECALEEMTQTVAITVTPAVITDIDDTQTIETYHSLPISISKPCAKTVNEQELTVLYWNDVTKAYDTLVSPSFVEAGEYIVRYQLSAPNHESCCRSVTFTIMAQPTSGSSAQGVSDASNNAVFSGSVIDEVAQEVLVNQGSTSISFQDGVTGVLMFGDTDSIPVGAVLSVAPVANDTDYGSMVTAQLGEGYELINAFDIQLLQDGQAVQPNGTLYIGLPVPEGYENVSTGVVHITDEGTIEPLASLIEADGVLTYPKDDEMSALMGDSVQSSDVQSGAVSAGSLTIPSGVRVTFSGAVSTGWARTDHLSIYALVAKVEDPAAEAEGQAEAEAAEAEATATATAAAAAAAEAEAAEAEATAAAQAEAKAVAEAEAAAAQAEVDAAAAANRRATGLAIGGILAAAIVAGIGVFYVKKARNQKEMNKE